jgi:hypothetical protein
MSRVTLIFGLVCATLALTGCYLPESWQQSDAELKRGYAKIAPPRPDTPSVYCYKTLSDPECLPVALPGQEYRLLAYYGPAPYVIQIAVPPQIIWQE